MRSPRRAGVCGLCNVARLRVVCPPYADSDLTDAAGADRDHPSDVIDGACWAWSAPWRSDTGCGQTARDSHVRRPPLCHFPERLGQVKRVAHGPSPLQRSCLPGPPVPVVAWPIPTTSLLCRRPSLRFPSSFPCATKPPNIVPLITEMTAALDGRWDYEIIYVNDGSTTRPANGSPRS